MCAEKATELDPCCMAALLCAKARIASALSFARLKASNRPAVPRASAGVVRSPKRTKPIATAIQQRNTAKPILTRNNSLEQLSHLLKGSDCPGSPREHSFRPHDTCVRLTLARESKLNLCPHTQGQARTEATTKSAEQNPTAENWRSRNHFVLPFRYNRRFRASTQPVDAEITCPSNLNLPPSLVTACTSEQSQRQIKVERTNDRAHARTHARNNKQQTHNASKQAS